MIRPQPYSRRTVLFARAAFVVAGCVLIALGGFLERPALSVLHYLGYVLQVLGALVLGFGAFGRGNLCAEVFLRLLNRIVN